MRVCMFACVRVRVCACVRVCVCAFVRVHVCVLVRVCIHIDICTQYGRSSSTYCVFYPYTHMYKHTHTHTRTHTHTHAHMHTSHQAQLMPQYEQLFENFITTVIQLKQIVDDCQASQQLGHLCLARSVFLALSCPLILLSFILLSSLFSLSLSSPFSPYSCSSCLYLPLHRSKLFQSMIISLFMYLQIEIQTVDQPVLHRCASPSGFHPLSLIQGST